MILINLYPLISIRITFIPNLKPFFKTLRTDLRTFLKPNYITSKLHEEKHANSTLILMFYATIELSLSN